jgi:hypothetical protein
LIMSDRAAALADRFERATSDLIATVEGCSDTDWQRACAAEGWPVGVTAHHVASTCSAINGLVLGIANDGELPNITMEMLDANNAKHASTPTYTRDETVALLRREGATIAQGLRGLTDAQLDRTTRLSLMGGNEVSAQQMAEMALIGHPIEHLASIKAALGQEAA